MNFKKMRNLMTFAGAALVCLFASNSVIAQSFEGAVYTMTNETDGNAVAAFGRSDSGTLTFLGNFDAGGLGSTEFDGGEGLDPLISADSLVVTRDQRFLVAVNAGSDTISSFRVNRDFTLTLVSTVSSGGVGPNSLAIFGRRVFVSNIDRDGLALGEPGTVRGEPNDEGNIVGFRLDFRGRLRRLNNSVINLDNRPADIGFSRNGRFLIVTSITAGSAALPGPNAANSVAVYQIRPSGAIVRMTGSATGTQVGNADGRNLASAIDFDTAVIGRREFVVVTEAREFNSEGAPPALPALQAGSVSVYELSRLGALNPVVEDIALGDPAGSPFDPENQLTTCWIDFGIDGRTFYVSNAINASISSFFLDDDGTPILLEAEAATGTSGFANGDTTGPEVFGTTDGFIDLDVTDDGEYLYQLEGLSGAIGAYKTGPDGSLTLVDRAVGDLPEEDTQGIITVSSRRNLVISRIRAFLIQLFTRLGLRF